MQQVRDRNLDKFAGPPRTPPKVADWHGDADLQMLNEFMRDELDNTTELIQLLESGGGIAANPDGATIRRMKTPSCWGRIY